MVVIIGGGKVNVEIGISLEVGKLEVVVSCGVVRGIVLVVSGISLVVVRSTNSVVVIRGGAKVKVARDSVVVEVVRGEFSVVVINGTEIVVESMELSDDIVDVKIGADVEVETKFDDG